MNEKKDTGEIKQKILSIINLRGPSLPVHIAREIKSDMLFTSAFLSELVSEKKLKLSKMRVGSSPLYFIPGQENQLEKFIEYLNHKEKEALELLNNKETLKDKDQEPSIRVALRSLRDFAEPFKKTPEGDIFWRRISPKTQIKEKTIKEENEKTKQEKNEEELGILENYTNPESGEEKKRSEEENEKELPKETKPIKIKERKKVKRKRSTSSSKTKKEKFFDLVKRSLDKQGIKLIDIVGFARGRISLIVEHQGKKHFLMAYNKKRINETDIGRASKGAKKHGLPYVVLSKGGPLKRIESLKKDLEKLSEFRKI